jgi:hypothetical protein
MKSQNTQRILGRRGVSRKQDIFATQYPAVLATYVTAQEEPRFLTEENRTQNISSISTSQEAKRVEIMQSSFCAKISKLSHFMNKIRIYNWLLG